MTVGSLPDLRLHISEITRAILGDPNRSLSTQRQLRFGTNGSIAVEIAGEKCGQWYDHETGTGGGPWELLTDKGGMGNGVAIQWLQSELGIEIKPASRTTRRMVASYDYRDERGDLLFQVCRFDPKTFRQRRPDGRDGWIWKKGTREVPYRLLELIAASADCIVFIVEGEKDVNRLVSLGLVATCNPGGAGKWRSSYNRFFPTRDVVILPDNDHAGRDHARLVASNLAPVASRVRVLALPDLPSKGDVSDWLDAGGTREELRRLAADAPTFSPKDDGVAAQEPNGLAADDEAEIARLAMLSPIECDRELADAAERLGCRIPTLRAAVAAARGNGAPTPGQGRPLSLRDPDPWPEPVDGAELLTALATAIRQYVVLGRREADAAALWVVGTHAFDAFYIFPRLLVTAPEKGCGKSTLLDVLSRLVPRHVGASSITAAALFRTIEVAHPTLLLDEADTYARDNEAIRGVINASHKRDGGVIRTVGDNHEPRWFSTWAPMALAAIGHLPGTIEQRSIIVRLRRRRPDEQVANLRGDRAGDLDELARKAARWARDYLSVLAAADPRMPAAVNNRAADNWRPLLAIADITGGEWPDRARNAASELTRAEEDSESAKVLLLGDLRELFNAEPSGVLFTREILAALHQREDRPWSEWKGKPISGRQVAALLKDFGVPTNKTVRRGTEHGKGYLAEDMADEWDRYLSPLSIGDTVTTHRNPSDFGSPIGDTAVPATAVVTDTKALEAAQSATCHPVTDPRPLLWRERL